MFSSSSSWCLSPLSFPDLGPRAHTVSEFTLNVLTFYCIFVSQGPSNETTDGYTQDNLEGEC